MAELDLGRVVGMGVPPGGTDGDVLVKNGSTDYSGKWTNTPPLMGSLAYINTGATADKLYNPGEYLVYNGQLYKVGSTAIGQSETLNPGQGGNITLVQDGGFNDLRGTLTNVENALSAGWTQSVLVSAEYGTLTCYYNTGLKLCLVTFAGTGTPPATEYVGANLPVGILPAVSASYILRFNGYIGVQTNTRWVTVNINQEWTVGSALFPIL